MSKIPVYDQNDKVVAKVNYTDNLDVWNGSNWQSGGTGLHQGITKLRKPVNGRTFVLVHGSQWQGSRSYGELISDKSALQKILKAEKDDLLKKYFPQEIEKLDLEEV